MNLLRSLLASSLALGLVFVLACSAAATPGTPRAASPKREGKEARVPSSGAAPKAPSESGDGAARVVSPAAEPPSAEPACPEDMVLVEGDYCTDPSNTATPDEHGNTPGAGVKDIDAVKNECLREWYAPQNKKRVCEEFKPETSCRGKMVKKRYCIDRYEWPNKAGAQPEVMNRFNQAQIKCAAVGKRLCTESEWTFACEGPEMLPFPYGYVRDANKCHGDEEWDAPNMKKVAQRDEAELRRLYKAEPSGEPECKSPFGVYDLPGNADEVVASETFEGKQAKYDSITTGGPWYSGVRNQCRPKIYTHDEGFYYYYMSFRCCAEADGAETDPRTPKQKKAKQSMKTVEGIAGVTVAEMKDVLERKKSDPSCGCKAKDTRCRTLCGTLHGVGWTKPRGESGGADASK